MKALPGDESLSQGFWFEDHQIQIAAPATEIWPWLVQMGNGRAGWYSYDWLDNLGRQSSRKILSEHQNITKGESFGLYSVDDYKEPEFLTFKFSKESNMTWLLDEKSPQLTMLLTRVRVGRFPKWLLKATLGPGHLIMQRKQFLEIKKRVENKA
ncbi:MAG: hypothetical protein HRT45_13720 [Bdellovibrionales bacterium]|nr:hypothetical protein [Bdellovibrionales bacterium]